jgi:hypothetical protein
MVASVVNEAPQALHLDASVEILGRWRVAGAVNRQLEAAPSAMKIKPTALLSAA